MGTFLLYVGAILLLSLSSRGARTGSLGIAPSAPSPGPGPAITGALGAWIPPGDMWTWEGVAGPFVRPPWIRGIVVDPEIAFPVRVNGTVYRDWRTYERIGR